MSNRRARPFSGSSSRRLLNHAVDLRSPDLSFLPLLLNPLKETPPFDQ